MSDIGYWQAVILMIGLAPVAFVISLANVWVKTSRFIPNLLARLPFLKPVQKGNWSCDNRVQMWWIEWVMRDGKWPR